MVLVLFLLIFGVLFFLLACLSVCCSYIRVGMLVQLQF